MSSNQERLLLRIQPDLTSIRFYLLNGRNEELVGTIENPLLLWDPSLVNKFSKSVTVKALFGSETLIEYDDISVIWNEDTWPPSIDSLFFAKVLKDHGYMAKRVSSIYDVGCGTGFLGIFMARKNHFVKRVNAIDIEPKAVELTQRNARLNEVADKFATEVGDFTQLEDFPHVDLVLSAPPYIPTFSDTDAHPFYGGTGLLDFLVRHARRLGEDMVLIYSHLANKEIENAKLDANVSGEILATREAPFRVRMVLKDPKWIDFLLHDRGLVKKTTDEAHGYPYWHLLKIERLLF